ncbi:MULTISPECIES: FAD binding domain-containing protein [Novosphingobium]|uniref:Carbon-monoxide dehydrogenase medium subunit n=1 Tax=Novosphingobium mathurense TaxID=428990 RepID=A0A1U6GVS5_9SPHN|nr:MULTISPECIES: xanthine dehydrogenase family protein subunit M [Novosphingobium]CDO36708.1 Carbon-monoxide dehydrogenase medium chain [Novosphingobium sp. KN65.2]SLJ87616.1 carbon-monoxide dehydrogenase medium subunit [Novosphingobium mathurense]
MPSPAFHAPDTVEGVVALLSGDPTARPLGGGTDLIVQMRSGRIAPGAVVDLKRIAALSGVRREGDVFVIGAATRCTALKDNADLCAAWPGVVEAANLIGSVQVRNRATMAGNLCNASPAADSVPALVAAGATCVVAGPAGTREVAVQDIPVSPGKTSLASGEFVVEFRLPARGARAGDAYLRSIPRTEMDIAVVGVGANLDLDAEGTCTAARIALGAVAPTVVLVEAAGAALVGTKLDDGALSAMVEAVTAACAPIDDKRGTVAYRKAMAGVLAKRTVQIAAERAGAKA